MIITFIVITKRHIALILISSTQCAVLVSILISARSIDSQHSNMELKLILHLPSLILPILHILLDDALLLHISELLSFSLK